MQSLKVGEKINVNRLSSNEKLALMKQVYSENSYFHSLFNQDQIEIDCYASALAFRQEIERLLLQKNILKKLVPLEKLHEFLSDDLRAYHFDDGVNKVSTYFYAPDQAFLKVYHHYISHLRKHVIKETFWFQATPTIRIHCPKSKNSHHYPRYHSDIFYGHPPEEINIWMPLTNVLSGHGFRMIRVDASKQSLEQFGYDVSDFIHSAIHDKDFSNKCDQLSHEVSTPFGKMLAFDSRCVHSGVPMKTHTRISMDIRILPLSQYQKMQIEYQGSGRRKILFSPGHCYHEKDSDYFLKD